MIGELMAQAQEVLPHVLQLVPPLETESDGIGWLLAAGPAAGAGLYWALYRYYRNTDKSHSFETETAIESQPVTGAEQKVDEVRGTRNRSIQGNNVSSHRQRVQRLR